MTTLFDQLETIDRRPEPFAAYTASDLWTDDHTSQQMLAFHLDGSIDISSRRAAFIERSVAWIASHFGVCRRTRIADFGCGPGLYTTRLARHGAAVTGIDFSGRSIAHARKVADESGLSIRYFNQDYLDFTTEDRFDLILMIMCDFCALSPSQRSQLLRTFYELLAAGGWVLLDVYSLNTFQQRDEASSYAENLLDGFWSAKKYYGFLNTHKYHDAKVLLDKYTIVEADRVRTIFNWLQCFSPESLVRELLEAGFDAPRLFGDVAGAVFDDQATEFAVAATKA